ncbi:MAG: DUF1636 domain-containing protein [Salinarimonadaceae bacterium]|nr:MAG: DUF1636 domain-containing protein [Salinarimonadaceae bacterium]
MRMRPPSQPVELLVCTRCRRDGEQAGDVERPGAELFRGLSEAAIDGVDVTPVECLSNCSRGCTIALRGAGRWTYVYGGFEAGVDVGTICEGVRKYVDSTDGLVPWRERPEHFRKNCIARLPPLSVAMLGEG